MDERRRIYRVLVDARGSVLKAAEKLGLTQGELRDRLKADPDLWDAALEALEQAIDEADAVLYEGLRSNDMTTRLACASVILRRAGKRGFGTRL